MTNRIDTKELSLEGIILRKIADVSAAMGWQAGTPALELAGLIVSHLACHPEHIPRFMAEGSGMIIDETIDPRGTTGCLTYRTMADEIISPTQRREIEGSQQ